MVLLRDMGQVEACFVPFRDSVILDTRRVYSLRGTCSAKCGRFGCTRWNSYVTWVKRKLVSIRSEIVLILVQDTCLVCAERTVGW
jgi:hypothetical protein